MKKFFVSLLILISISLFSQDEKRLALVIGNSNYDSIAKLANPVNDAKLIAKTLESLDFEVILATDLDKGEFMSKVVEFGKKRANYDVGFIYYAGHGVQIDGENYLLPTNQNFDEEWKVEEYAINVNRIMKYLTAITDQVNILILDACRNNPWEGNFRSIGKSNKGGLAKIPAPTGSLIAFSTDYGALAADGYGKNSMYCKSLVKNMVLENTTLDQVFRNVRADVLNESNTIEDIVNTFNIESVDGVYGDLLYVDKQNINKIIRNWKSCIFEKKLLNKGWMPPHPTLFLKKNIYHKYGLFDLNYSISSDYEFILRIFKNKSLKFTYIPNVISKMRIGGASNRNIKNIINKTIEDYRALKSNNIGNLFSLIRKNTSKIKQFFIN